MRARSAVLAQSLMHDWSGQLHRSSRTARLLSTTTSRASRLRARLDIPPPFPVTKSCPEPSCNCPPTPNMPEGLPIDHHQTLNGTMAAYAQQLLICTDQRDWTSRIENDGENKGWGNLVRGLKRLLGRGGPYLDVCRSIPLFLVRNNSDHVYTKTFSPLIMSSSAHPLSPPLRITMPLLHPHFFSPASNISPLYQSKMDPLIYLPI